MQTFRDKPALAIGLLVVALVAVFLSWFLFCGRLSQMWNR
jgi:hypothetical protein